MSQPQTDELLQSLNDANSSAAWQDLAASSPTTVQSDGPAADPDAELDALVSRINQLADNGGVSIPNNQPIAVDAPIVEDRGADNSAADALAETPLDDNFVPHQPNSLEEADLTQSEVEALILKYLLARGEGSGRDISEQIRLPFLLIEDLLAQMKKDDLVGHKGAAAMNDFRYTLTVLGRQMAKRYSEHCTYFGSAPVSLAQYIECVEAQSLAGQHPTVEDLRRAFEDLLIDPEMLRRLGPAINSGRGLFLYGAPGNGKTSIAERVTACFGETVWIPRAIGIDGEIMRLYDPMNHEEAPLPAGNGVIRQQKIDERWIRIKRPTVVVGGELTMDQLEVTLNTATGINESPLQMKSNCGTLVIDDFGRQRMTTDELLNRWIVPLEKRYDFLNLASGKKIQVPFDQLIIFSTNLEPRDLVDEAFLRRIPYKIEVIDPVEANFRELMKIMAKILDVPYEQDAIDYVVEKHYKQAGRPFRNCQPRDLLLQVKNYCLYEKKPIEMTPEYFDYAVENYFAVM